jgi:hypothetical protein
MSTRQEILNDYNIDLDIAEQHPGRCKPHKNTYYINGIFAIVKLQDDTYMICSTDEHSLHLLSNVERCVNISFKSSSRDSRANIAAVHN